MEIFSSRDDVPGLIAFGASPIGVIAIGGNPIGVIALGMSPSGLVSVGMFSRGVFSFGVLAFGVYAFGLGVAFGAVARGLGVVIGGVARGVGAGLGIDVEVLGTEGFLQIGDYPLPSVSAPVVVASSSSSGYRGAQPGEARVEQAEPVPSAQERSWKIGLAWRTALFVAAIGALNAGWSTVAHEVATANTASDTE